MSVKITLNENTDSKLVPAEKDGDGSKTSHEAGDHVRGVVGVLVKLFDVVSVQHPTTVLEKTLTDVLNGFLMLGL